MFLLCLFRIQPVYVADVASAIVAALKDDGTSMGKVYELGGPEIYTMHELVYQWIIYMIIHSHYHGYIFYPEAMRMYYFPYRQN